MSLKSKISIFKTVAFRLTLWYMFSFTVFCAVMFVATYMTITSQLNHRIDESLLEEMKEMEMIYKKGGLTLLKEELLDEANPVGVDVQFFLVLSQKLNLLASTDLKDWKGMQPFRVQAIEADKTSCRIDTVTIHNRKHKVKLVTKKMSDGIVIQIGLSLIENDQLLRMFSDVIFLSSIILLVCGSGLCWFITRRAMQGVVHVTKTAVKIKNGNLDQRVTINNQGTEIVNLAVVFNEMIEKIGVLVDELKNIANNIAHDLRTPITRIRGIAETTLVGDESIENYREMTGLVVEECQSMASMIDTVLDIAEADTSFSNLKMERVDIREILKTACELFELPAKQKQVSISLDCPNSSVIVKGDSMKLKRVVANLIDNAVKYTPINEKIFLTLKTDKTNVYFIVKNTGAGISKKNQKEIFKRFYRCDVSRTKHGNGLGLSLALAIVKSYGGTITVESIPDIFTLFTVTLPSLVE